MLRLRTFGGLALTAAERELKGAAVQRRPLALLAVLAVAGDRGVSRERLQSLLWPESDTDRARRVLAQTVYALRRDLGDPAVIQGTADLRLNAALVSADVTAFERALEAGEPRDAASLYEGPFLDGVHIDGSPEFERWAEGERTRLARRAHDTLTHLARQATELGDPDDAAGWWRRLAVLDPLDGRVAVGLMEALAAAGDHAGALRHARVHEALLREELGAPPEPAVSALAARLRTPPRPLPPVFPPAAPPAPGASPPAPGDAGSHGGDDADARAAAATGAAPDASAARRMRRPARTTLWVVGVGATVLLAAVVAAWTGRSGDDAPLDPTLIAVAPFRVLDPTVELWRQGMVDVLSRNLDGAGPLRAVPPTVVFNHWADRDPDRRTAIELGRATGARLVIIGGLLSAGPDSVRATVSIVDVVTGEILGEVARHDAEVRMDRLTDSLTVAVLRELGARRPIGAASGSSLASATSLDALKAFLRGEQFLRRARWDSARAYYERAVARDSGLALAWRGIGNTIAWQHLVTDTLAATALLRAGALNRGLGLRDSLLVAADSLGAAANAAPTIAEEWPFRRRLFATLDQATRRYPNDPEAWFALGEARYHFGAGPIVGVPDEMALRAFDRAIALDSTFAPAYIHAVELALTTGGPALASRYVRGYLALDPTADAHRSVALVGRLIEPAEARSPATARLLDTLPTEVLHSAYTMLRRWPDSAETALRLARRFATGDHASRDPRYEDERFQRRVLAEQLAYRGRVREARRVSAGLDAGISVVLPYLEAMPRDSAAAVLARRLEAKSPWTRQALRWWAATGDTLTLRRFLNERLPTARSGDDPAARAAASYDTAAARAYLALVRGDSTAALQRFVALPDTLCPTCALDRLTEAELLAAHGRHREALTVLGEPPVAYLTPVEIMLAAARARVAMRLGACDVAATAYGLVARAWAHADPALQPMVAEARIAGQRARRNREGCTARAGELP